MAVQTHDLDETTTLLGTDLPKLRPDYVSAINYPSESLTQLLKSTTAVFHSDNGIFRKLSFFIKYTKTMLYTRLIIIYFVFLFLVSIFSIILCFVPILDLLISFGAVITLSCFGSLFGMKLIYDWFFMEQRTLDDLRKEGIKRENEREQLEAQKDALTHNVKDIQLKVSTLSFCAADLEHKLMQYDVLKQELLKTLHKNETIQGLLDRLLSMMEDIRFLKKENAKADILRKYYHIAFKGKNSIGLKKDSYDRFVARLDTECRSIIQKCGGFEKYDTNGDGVIEAMEFMYLLEDVIIELQEQELNEENY